MYFYGISFIVYGVSVITTALQVTRDVRRTPFRFFSSGPSSNIDTFSKQPDVASTMNSAESAATMTGRKDEKQTKMMEEAAKLRRQAAELEVCHFIPCCIENCAEM